MHIGKIRVNIKIFLHSVNIIIDFIFTFCYIDGDQNSV